MPVLRRWVVLLAPLFALPPPARAAAAPRVPEVVVGPAALEAAPRIAAPIAEVTVYSDRARVRRRGTVAVAAGATLVRLPELPGAVFADTIRLSASGARVLRVEATPVERERFAIDEARKLLDELDAVDDRLVELGDRVALDEWLAGLVTRLAPAAPVSEEKREGRKALVVDVPSWGKVLDFVGERATAARTRVAAAADERRTLAERRDRLRADVAALNQGGFSTRIVDVSAVLEGQAAGTAEVELEYFVPGARWKPVYELHYAPARGQLRVETAAAVEQTTGEDWSRVALALSTAMPARGIDAPELLTWTLGERSEMVPRLRPKQQPSAEPPLVAPPPPAPASDVARAIEIETLRARLARATNGTPPPPITEVDRDAEVPAAKPQRVYRAPRRSYAPSSAPSGAPAAAPAMAPMEEAEESLPPAPAPSVQVASVSRAPSGVSVPLALVDTTVARQAPSLGDPYLPAVSAGGLDYVYRAPTKASVPSTGVRISIPLVSQAFRAAAFYEATPGIATTAFLRARVRNDGKVPLLRGPATIFGDGELVGVGEIQTTGPGGDIELPLGADQDIRLTRQVVPSSKTTGLVMKSEETTYDVQIQVGNYKKQPVTIEALDQLPASRRDKVEVKLLGTDPAPQGAPDADGVVRWRLDVPAGGTRTIRLRYQIVRPKGWVLFQR